MRDIVPVWKPLGWTPLKAVNVFKERYDQYADQTISYAGRLDPMAEGVLVLLVGEENKKRQLYQDLRKSYEFEVVWGLTTDSYDALGLIKGDFTDSPPSDLKIQSMTKELVGTHSQPYPPYSSKAVGGKPLFWWSRNNKLSDITVPTRTVNIYSLNYQRTYKINVQTLIEQILKKIDMVEGDFRQEEICRSWQKLGLKCLSRPLSVSRFFVSASSGTYVRALVSEFGEKMSCGAFTLSITRTSVGEFKKEDCLVLN